MEAEISKEDMLSPLSGSSPGNNNSDSDPRPVNANPNLNPHLFPSNPTTLNNSSGGGGGAGFSLTTTANAVVESESGQKKKRGRPRKYDADGNLRISYATPPGVSPPLHPPPGFGESPKQTASFVMKARSSSAFGFGEMFAHTALGEFTPHVVTVKRGEDVAAKILLLGQQGHKGICVLSAIGVVSNVTIRQPSSSGGILTYEGRFEILSLTGSYTVASSVSGGQGWVGALSVSLAGPDGRVVGGSLAGSMTAASPTQLVLGSFTPGGYKPQKRKYVRQQPKPLSTTPLNVLDPVTAAKPISQAMPAEDAFHSQSSHSLEQSHEEDEEANQPMRQQQNVVASHGIWSFGPSPDINLSIHGRVTP
ncbi:unnamed protein product [Rhodiola kirilowii]